MLSSVCAIHCSKLESLQLLADIDAQQFDKLPAVRPFEFSNSTWVESGFGVQGYIYTLSQL